MASGLESGLPFKWYYIWPFNFFPWVLYEALAALSIVWVFDWTSVDDSGIVPDPAKKKPDETNNTEGEGALVE